MPTAGGGESVTRGGYGADRRTVWRPLPNELGQPGYRLRSSVVYGLSLSLACAEEAPVLEVLWTPNPNPRVPLALAGTLTTSRPTRARVVLDDGERPWMLERWPDFASQRELAGRSTRRS